jgi:hypothetical protein
MLRRDMPQPESRPAAPAPAPSASLPGRAPSAVERLVRTVQRLPTAERWWGPGCAGRAGWFRERTAPTVDASERFGALLARVRRGEAVLPDEAPRHLYLLVQGILGDRLFGYLLDNQQRLARRGLETREVPVDTQAPLRANVEVLREVLRDAAHFNRTVVLLGHSKGGLECTATLALHPELRPVVRTLVAMQAPYGGSPIADDLTVTPDLRRLVGLALPLLFNGVPRSVEDMSYDSREAFLARHPYPAGVPTVSLATSRYSRRSSLWLIQRYLRERYGYASDGLVCAVDAEVPGSRVVRLEDMDHAESSLLGLPGFSNYHPGDVTEALVALALETPAR